MNNVVCFLWRALDRKHSVQTAILTSATAADNYRQYAHCNNIITNWYTLVQLNQLVAKEARS